MEFTKAENKESAEAEKMSFGEKLYALRKKNGLSQQAVAEALQVSRQAVSRWELGTSVPTMENLAALSSLYAVPVDELIGNGAQERKETSCPQEDTTAIWEVPVQPKLCMNKKLLAGICAVILTAGIITAAWYIKETGQESGEKPIEIESMLSQDIPLNIEEGSFS